VIINIIIIANYARIFMRLNYIEKIISCFIF